MSALTSRLRDLQFRLEYALLRAVIGVVRAVPLDAASAISGRTWRFLAPKLSPKRHARALDNLAIAFPREAKPSAGNRAGTLGEPRPRHGRDDAHRPLPARWSPSASTSPPNHLLALQGQARADVGRQPAHGQLGAGDPGRFTLGRRQARPPSIARSTTPTSTSICATSARISIPTGCLVAATSAITARIRRRRAPSWISCAAAAALASSAISTTAPACRCRSSAGMPRRRRSPR